MINILQGNRVVKIQDWLGALQSTPDLEKNPLICFRPAVCLETNINAKYSIHSGEVRNGTAFPRGWTRALAAPVPA